MATGQSCSVSQTVKPGTPTDDNDSENLGFASKMCLISFSDPYEDYYQWIDNFCDKFKPWKQEKAKEPEGREKEFLVATKSRRPLIIDTPGIGASTFLEKVLFHKHIKRDLDTPLGVLWLVKDLPQRPKRRSKRNFFASTTQRPKRRSKRNFFASTTKRPKRRNKRNFFASTRSVYPEDMPSNSPQAKQKLISGVYGIDRGNNRIQVLKMEHSALQGPNSQWNFEVKCKVRENKTSANRWVNIWNIYPDAKVELKRNEIELTISSPNEDHEFAVFGTPGTGDKKRMQMGIFGGKPKQGKHLQIFVTLFDDTMMAFKRVCEREERNGRQLLTTLAGLFVANSDKDIKIDITGLEDGWEIIGSHFMAIKSKDAWNSPENSTDFPYCVFEIAHIDETKQTFFCGIQASHLNDTAETELLEFFEQEQENEENLNSQNFIPPPKLMITEDKLLEVLEKTLDKLADATRNGWESLARALTFTGGKRGGLFDLPLHWKQEQTEAFVSFLMLVYLVGCLTGTRFVTHLLKVEETEGRALLSLKE